MRMVHCLAKEMCTKLIPNFKLPTLNTMSAMPLRQKAAKKVNTALALLLENSWLERDCVEKVQVKTQVRGREIHVGDGKKRYWMM